MIDSSKPDNTKCYFGTGDIRISSGLGKINIGDEKNNGILTLRRQDPPRKIGEVYENNEVVNYDDCPVIMFFSKTESIDALIHQLETIKRYMIEENGGNNNE